MLVCILLNQILASASEVLLRGSRGGELTIGNDARRTFDVSLTLGPLLL
jgi:hypothetical protein